MFENCVHDGLYREVIHSNSPFIRGFAKLKKMPKIQRRGATAVLVRHNRSGTAMIAVVPQWFRH